MATNKKSGWSTVILVATIISLVVLIVSVISLVVSLPAASALAHDEAIKQGLSENDANLASALVIGSLVSAFAVGIVFDVMKVIGGFMFSLRGRGGMFCIIASAIAFASDIWSLVSNITNNAGALSIVVDVISMLVSCLLFVACLMHRKENKA